MSGIRIHHANKVSCQVEVLHMGRPTPTGPKVYRVQLDHDGDAIVSETVWHRLQEAYGLLGYCPFLMLNEVKRPPTLIINGQPDPRPIIRDAEVRQ
jgi:hypothetical protein